MPAQTIRFGRRSVLAGAGFLLGTRAVPLRAQARAAGRGAVIIARQDPGTLDYVNSRLTALRLWIPANVVEPLVYFNKDGSVSPAVAEAWSISADKRSYTFRIRQAKFSNGAPITADDVLYSLGTMSKSPIAAYAAAYRSVAGMEKLDDRTIKVTLSAPSQLFWFGMGSMSGLIQPAAAAGGIATNPIGSGPYKLVRYVPNSVLEFTANPEHWAGPPPIQDVAVRIVPDGTAALNAMQAGEADAYPAVTVDLWEQVGKRGLDKSLSLITYPQLGEPTYAVLNAKLPLAMRQTIAATLDRAAFKEAFGASWGAETTCTYALPNQSWYRPGDAANCPYPYDLEKASRTVKSEGFDRRPLIFASLSDVPDLSLPADLMIAEMEAAGFKVERHAMDLARYSQLVFQGQPPQFDVTVMSSAPDPTQFACPDPSKVNWNTYCSAEYTAALGKADASLTVEDYNKWMAEAASILRKDAVIVPLLAKTGVGLFRHELQGFLEPRLNVSIELSHLHWS
ncbi:MAG: ABC transporter substrate-binding protein [Acetobacteraceae bacterium]|nr:ABC transporter substrate-binding protein [Acetobacteraceae bacterium]